MLPKAFNTLEGIYSIAFGLSEGKTAPRLLSTHGFKAHTAVLITLS